MWLPLDTNFADGSEVDESTEYHYYNYIWSGYLISGWMYMNVREISKFLKSHGIAWDIVSDQKVYLYYKTDDDSAWTYVGVYSAWSDLDLDLSSNDDVSGKRVRIALVFENDINSQAIKVYESSVDASIRFTNKYDYPVTFLLEDDADTLLAGVPDPEPVALNKYNELDAMASMTTPVSMDVDASILGTSKKVFVEPASLQIMDKVEYEGKERWICQMVLKGI
jgi:hypothetical protein